MIFFRRAKIPQSEHMNCIVMGKRYTAKQALEAKIIHYSCKGNELMNKAMELSRQFIKQEYDSEALQQLKFDLYHREYRSLGENPPKYYDSKL